jgi:ketosteroid isomerase-like protein
MPVFDEVYGSSFFAQSSFAAQFGGFFEPQKWQVVFTQAEVSLYESGSRNIASLLAPLQFRKQATPRMQLLMPSSETRKTRLL